MLIHASPLGLEPDCEAGAAALASLAARGLLHRNALGAYAMTAKGTQLLARNIRPRRGGTAAGASP